jgi:hypothetical protein
MTRRNQIRLIFHGALFILLSTLVAAYPGLPRAFFHPLTDSVRQYLRQGHAILMATGMFMIATSAALPLLELTDRGISWIVWSFVISGYTFLGAFGTLFLGFRHHPPIAGQTQWEQTMAIGFPLSWANIVLVGVSGATSFIPGLLIVIGAYKASRHSVLYDVR